ncbi:flavodoxin-dependent (E)-4-hydroxy-3-methylbut-2-enyl-diphosphate synthase [Sphaerobacter thermophilus]|jgi:(E)-4-hydroxy-3-methylbut-2-enyl-diphosphate synthase|uniref:4-hydroxy-3-methylbut-2-en-1-yl diphosphate synthase (flavodoxin) n=1 Tax=Sphaerobacter thermophilus (strain ATCC 49802 / DSM 20745 / KCCM 41009 / NCIMB 13125 / S 6022) TaxID=479434 RepID=D1C7R8_SPHTD|nr:flavodoxin-dependent (E)-4-hydroxy-3-methylbut-2-enyl-diphosphate synthase [Sphaerobacter thermophilus]ACZ37901.1 1-hydroxy-2-methyl-2-(E)-butenyl 4-diphosphate synthase [Sphaerobacter thermophilus DSM 20745]PZN67022.1 MAG: flavodoxin-dependent (E)-4-hydroxy-3-methylbut-2-enyl-diphosphate synthase [Sphaerobacter thermophilus]
MVAPRRKTRAIHVGDVQIGGGAPVVVQSMATADTRDPKATLRQIHELADAGCEIVRIAVPDRVAAAALPEIVPHSPVPLIADIHFEHTLALKAIDAGIHGLRLNPGNIRKPEDVREVVTKAKERGIPIRIGVNFGSLPPMSRDFVDEMAEKNASQVELIAEHMVRTALGHVKILEDLDFGDIKISLKAFEVPVMLEAYRRMAPLNDYPLHLGVTEAGTPKAGTIRSAVGIGTLLAEGIGDTIRVSLTTDPVEEVFVAYEILKSLGLRQHGATLVACPTCGRVEVDLFKLANEVDEYIKNIKAPIKVAVMGCVVNGPGEARDSDVGVAAGRGKGVIFRKGQIVRRVEEDEIVPALKEEIQAILAERGEA